MLNGQGGQPLRSSSNDDGLGQGVFRPGFKRNRRLENPFRHSSLRGQDIRHLRLSPGQGACLVEDHGGQPISLFQAFSSLDQDAVLRPQPRAHHDRRGCGQTQRAGTGDDQDGNKIQEGAAEDRFRDEKEPHDKSQQRYRNDNGNENGRHTIGKPLDRGLGTLSFFHQPDNLGKSRFRTDLRGFKGKAAAAVQGGAEDLGARLLVRRHAFPREHGFVHR
ncbi:MAG: hypothetical protein A4E69_00742 [Syntrophus sp. PtaB.Bin138]|nr:MAG: hypothetical protein A4E69_00742 [Syntrophus sp. PtaB.Bin138]